MQVNGSNNFITAGNPVEALSNLHEPAEMPGIKTVSDGEIISGVVTDISDGVVSIDLGQNVVVNARCDAALNLIMGSKVSMLVSTLPGQTIELKPLFTNMAQEQLAGRAIADAGLPCDDISMKLVSDLLSEGMSIDKDSLNTMYRQVVSNPEVSSTLIVRMNKMGMEIKPSNVQGFNAADNFADKISDTVKSIADLIPDEITQMCDAGQSEDAVAIFKECINIIAEDSDFQNIETMNPDEIKEQALPDAIQTEIVGEIDEATAEDENKQSVGLTLKPGNPESEIDISKDSIQGKEIESVLPKEGDGKSSLTEIIKNEISALHSKSDNGTLNSEDIYKFFETTERKAVFKEALTKAFAIKPEEFAGKSDVKEFYDELCDKVKQISAKLMSTVSGNENLSTHIENFTRNVDFVDQLNKFVPYIQLPIKMGDNSRTGDLCVYANKRNLSEANDNITALLRLDMQYLGYTEVYVALQESKVTTNFRLESEESLNLIQSHINELTDRLESKGYSLDVNTSVIDRNSSLSEVIAGAGTKSVAGSNVGTNTEIYRFDARA